MTKRKEMEEKKSQELWNTYFQDKTNKTSLQALVAHYFPWVEKIALKVADEMNWRYSSKELASFGAEALYSTIPAYDTERGVRFESFATRRVKGAMIDGLRREDPVPRSVRIASDQFDKHKQRLQNHVGHRLSDVDFITMIGMDENEYHKNFRKYTASTCGSLDNHDETSEDIKQDSNDNLLDNNAPTPDACLRRKEFFSKLMSGCSSKQEQQIIYLYYYKDLTMDRVAKIIGLSESRVSQKHKKILERLRAKVKRNPKFFDKEITTFIRSSNHNLAIF